MGTQMSENKAVVLFIYLKLPHKDKIFQRYIGIIGFPHLISELLRVPLTKNTAQTEQ